MSFDRTGEIIDARFRIDALIGRGAMAEVYRALDLTTQAYVALKILKRQLANDREARVRFSREGDVQARLRHPNVAALLATGVTQIGEPYLAVELLRGTSLRGVIRSEGKVAPRRAVDLACQALAGLSAVHAAGVLHRDLKPANIMLEAAPHQRERVVLIDFGFASFEGQSRLTLQGMVVGSLRYIAPERLRGEALDPRSDLYAMAAILFELLTGQPPFVCAGDLELVEAHLNTAPPSLHERDPSLPASLDAVLACALEKQVGDRYETAAEMRSALEGTALSLA